MMHSNFILFVENAKLREKNYEGLCSGAQHFSVLSL